MHCLGLFVPVMKMLHKIYKKSCSAGLVVCPHHPFEMTKVHAVMVVNVVSRSNASRSQNELTRVYVVEIQALKFCFSQPLKTTVRRSDEFFFFSESCVKLI